MCDRFLPSSLTEDLSCRTGSRTNLSPNVRNGLDNRQRQRHIRRVEESFRNRPPQVMMMRRFLSRGNVISTSRLTRASVFSHQTSSWSHNFSTTTFRCQDPENESSSSSSRLVQPVTTNPQFIFPPFAQYSHGCLVDPSSCQLLFTSGQLGITPSGHVPATAQEQATVALENVRQVLLAAGVEPGQEWNSVIRFNAFVTDRAYFADYMKARDQALSVQYTNNLALPASTLVIVSGFTRPEFLVEIEAVASVPKSTTTTRTTTSSSTTTTTTTKATCHAVSAQQQQQKRQFHSPCRPVVTGIVHSPRQQQQQQQRRSLHTLSSEQRVDEAAVQAAVDELRNQHNIDVVVASEDERSYKTVALKSRDYYWYSPILKPLLRGKKAHAVVTPKSEDEVVQTARIAAVHRVPLTTRGAGTGNYGQAVPLRGGLILDMSALAQIESFDTERGIIRVGAGALLQMIEDQSRQHGWELRQHPSTRRQATIGGFVAGGSTGHGGLMHGGLAEDGAVLSVRVVTANPEDTRVLELSGADVAPIVHAYGTNGIITSVEIPLARAQPWTDVTVVFSSLREAAQYALQVANAPAIVKRAISVFQAPIAHAYLEADRLLHAPNVVYENPALAADGNARHVCIAQCTYSSLGPLERLAEANGGQITRTMDALQAPRPFYEFGWNHTTLHTLRQDKSVTYLQAALNPEIAMDLVEKIEAEFDSTELLQHLEVLNFQGRMGFAALSLLWPHGSDPEAKNQRLRAIMKWHEDQGAPIFDPHTHVLEDGGMKETNWAQLGFKRRADPNGILNPGKMRAWEEQAATHDSNSNEAFSRAYRLAELPSKAEDNDDHDKIQFAKAPKSKSRYWAEWSTADFAKADLTQTVAILPLGATEAHGPHLPLGVDSMHNADLLDRALKKLDNDPENSRVSALALPPLEIGVSCEHSGFAGTLEISFETAASTWIEIGACVARTGIRKLILYNSHGGNQALAEVVARRLREKHGMLCVLAMNLAQGGTSESITSLFPADEMRYGIHGGAVETSIMLHLRPDLVSIEAAKDFASDAAKQPKESHFQYHMPGFGNKMGWLSQDLNPAGVVGAAASLSDAEKGAVLSNACAENFAALVREVYRVNVDEVLGSDPLFPSQG